MYKVIVVDLDGTLVETRVEWESIRTRVRRILGLDENAPLKPIAKVLFGEYAGRRGFHEAVKLVEEEELKSIDTAKCPRSIPQVLMGLREKGYTLVLVTLRSRKTAEPLLKKFGLEKAFNLILTREDACDRTLQLTLVAERLGAKTEDILFIGDWSGDKEAGEKTGVETIIVRNPDEAASLLGKLLS